MDDGMLGHGIDAFVQASFGGSTVRTSTNHVKGKRISLKDLNCDFHEELWLPVSLPSMVDEIQIAVGDKGLLSNTLCGMATASSAGDGREWRRTHDPATPQRL